MSGSSRRGFIKVAGVGAGLAAGASMGALAGAPAAAAADAATAPEVTGAALSLARGPLVAHVRDLANGRVTLMVDSREFTITDRRLVAALSQALHTAQRATAV